LQITVSAVRYTYMNKENLSPNIPQEKKPDTRLENFRQDLTNLDKEDQSFLGVHLAQGEDGRIPKKPDGTPITLREMEEYQNGGSDPFRLE